MRFTCIEQAIEEFASFTEAKATCTTARDDHRLYARMDKAVKYLAAMGDEGRSAFEQLLFHASPHVRCWVAAELLSRGQLQAKNVLEELHQSGGPASFDAEITLREHAAGKLGSPFPTK